MRDFVYIPCVILALFASLPVPSRALPDMTEADADVPSFVDDTDFQPAMHPFASTQEPQWFSFGTETVDQNEDAFEPRFAERGAPLKDLVVTLSDLGIKDWQYPMSTVHSVGSPYGPRTKTFSTGTRLFHHGHDIACERGEDIYAVADGIVSVSVYSPTAGHYVTLSHKGDEHVSIETRYLHLSKRLVRHNREVKAGDLIGRCGNTGQSTGPHLHFEVIVDGKTRAPFRHREKKDLHQCEESLEYVAEYPTSELSESTDEQSRL